MLSFNNIIHSDMILLIILAMFISICLFMCRYKYSIQYILIISFCVIIFIYATKKEEMRQSNGQKEGFQTKLETITPFVAIPRNPFCNDDVNGNVGLKTGTTGYSTSVNQSLSRKNSGILQQGNIKTYMPPYNTPPTHDFNYWRATNLSNRSNINSSSPREMFLNGYAVTTCQGSDCRIVNNKHGVEQEYKPYITEAFNNGRTERVLVGSDQQFQQSGGPIAPKMVFDPSPIPTVSEAFTNNRTERVLVGSDQQFQQSGGPIAPKMVFDPSPIPKISFDNSLIEKFDESKLKPMHSDYMTVNGVYNPDQLNNNLPSNLIPFRDQLDSSMKEYNRNTFTQMIAPGVYTSNQIIEPIQTNIGISRTQQFQPTTKQYDSYGNVYYVQHDPRVFNEVKPQQILDEVRPDNVYDPRLSGYGTSYRGYTDNLLGQPKFFYDDIDAVRNPAYISRSNIDHLKFADSIGIKEGYEEGNPNTDSIRLLANNAKVEQELSFRTDLQESLTRKIRSNEWQQKIAPIGMYYR
jgi:hypothetical protein